MSLDEVAGYIFLGADEDGNGYIDRSELNKYSNQIGKFINCLVKE